jgi:hypothetical protein
MATVMPMKGDREAACRGAGREPSRGRAAAGGHLEIWIKRAAPLKVLDERAKGRKEVSIFLNRRFARAAPRV